MTFLEICKSVRREAGQAGDGPTSVSNQQGIYAKVVDWVRLAYREIVDEHRDWSFLWSRSTFTFLETKRDYTPAEIGLADLKKVLRIKFDTTPIGETKMETYRDRLEDRTDEGTPSTFTVLPNGNIAFTPMPLPGSTMKVEYYRTAPDLMVDGDVPLLPAEYHNAILWLAVVYCATDQENGALAGRANAVYMSRMDGLNRDCRKGITT